MSELSLFKNTLRLSYNLKNKDYEYTDNKNIIEIYIRGKQNYITIDLRVIDIDKRSRRIIWIEVFNDNENNIKIMTYPIDTPTILIQRPDIDRILDSDDISLVLEYGRGILNDTLLSRCENKEIHKVLLSKINSCIESILR